MKRSTKRRISTVVGVTLGAVSWTWAGEVDR